MGYSQCDYSTPSDWNRSTAECSILPPRYIVKQRKCGGYQISRTYSSTAQYSTLQWSLFRSNSTRYIPEKNVELNIVFIIKTWHMMGEYSTIGLWVFSYEESGVYFVLYLGGAPSLTAKEAVWAQRLLQVSKNKRIYLCNIRFCYQVESRSSFDTRLLCSAIPSRHAITPSNWWGWSCVFWKVMWYSLFYFATSTFPNSHIK